MGVELSTMKASPLTGVLCVSNTGLVVIKLLLVANEQKIITKQQYHHLEAQQGFKIGYKKRMHRI